MSISNSIIIVIFVIIAAIIFIIKNSKNKDKQIDFEYQIKTLFTPAERSFLGVLNQAVEENAKIFGKTRIADVLTPKKGLTKSKRQSAINRITNKHFDFILCDKNDLSILCAIELNDKSHINKNVKKRDAIKEKICISAGLQLIKITAKKSYVVEEIKEKIKPFIINRKL